MFKRRSDYAPDADRACLVCGATIAEYCIDRKGRTMYYRSHRLRRIEQWIKHKIVWPARRRFGR